MDHGRGKGNANDAKVMGTASQERQNVQGCLVTCSQPCSTSGEAEDSRVSFGTGAKGHSLCLVLSQFENHKSHEAQDLAPCNILQNNLGVPPGRGNCPLTVPLPFDLIYTDYHGLQQMKQHMGLSFKKYR
ncbi:hypothetical protein A6R68_12077 [Neotoma lepida]|uniref:Glycosyltransferase family 18 catalytic domain-containing protein n=1 Tax=Neotoma lepida TaxID=56216 RepID=A0A1A6H6D3_NEOLE|nr:hypothetical protein A6R68_12077 [Neotoma lepida]